MVSFRKLLLVGVGVVALHGLQACASETELNPQPLPPGDETARAPEGASDDGTNQGTGGSGSDPAPPAADAGTEGGDASDGGADG
jgi:hypothetical protein